MKFVSLEQKKRFSDIRDIMPEQYQNDKERLVVAFLMAGNEDLHEKIKPYMNWYEFDYEKMFAEVDFSAGLHTLAKLSVVLYNSGVILEFSEFKHLDEANFELAMMAISYRYGNEKNSSYKEKSERIYMD